MVPRPLWNSSRSSVVKAICVSEISENKIFQEPMDLAEKSFEAFEGLKTNSWKIHSDTFFTGW